jgi:predicted RNA binding protein YcfA (HicA-like mRNA interferase family)
MRRAGYEHIRTSGDHFILRGKNGHTFPVPQHKPLKVGTIADILKDVAQELEISVSELKKRLEI